MSEIITFKPRQQASIAAAARSALDAQCAAKCMQIERMAYAVAQLADTPKRKYRAMHIANLAKWLADEFSNDNPPGGAAA